MKVFPLGANRTEVRVGEVRILISYETPVAAFFYDKARAMNNGDVWISDDGSVPPRTQPFWREEKRSSATTTKHINKWMKQLIEDTKDTVFSIGAMPVKRSMYLATHEEIAELMQPKVEGIRLEVTL